MHSIKGLGKSLLGRFGYEVRTARPVRLSVDALAAMTVKDSQYYTSWSTRCPIFTPWVGHPDFRTLYEGVASYTEVSPDRCYMLASLARYATHLHGDFAECGVYKGGTALLLSRVLDTTGKRLFLFDSFQGLPRGDQEKDKWFYEGQYAVDSVESVRELLIDFRHMIDIREGWIPETFAGLENRRYSFAHLDVDLYQSALDCCGYFYPRMVPGAVMLFDEYGFPAARGEKDAVDEFFADKPEAPIPFVTGQAMILKLPPGDQA